MSACMPWTGRCNKKGYGVRPVKCECCGRISDQLVHRLAWIETNGPVPEGLFVLHHCDNPPCRNVDHLFLGTAADNSADMKAKGRWRNQFSDKAPPSHCIHGHEMTPENTTKNARGHRICVACRHEVDARSARKRRS